MKFKVNSKALYTTLSTVSKVINSKNAMTILNNFLFEIKGDNLSITASDLENTLTASIEIKDSEDDGKFCVDARRMVELFKELPEVDIDFQVSNDLQIKISHKDGIFDFAAIPGEEYPTTIHDDEQPIDFSFKAPCSQIIDGIENTLFAVGNDDLRPQMMGIFLDIIPEQITFVSTDTRKLVRYINSTAQPGITGSFILPAKPANILRQSLVRDEEVMIDVTSKAATFTTGHISFNCRLIKGNFPSYNNVIPKQTAYKLDVDRSSMLNAIRRVSVFVDPSHGLVKFRITPDSIELKAQDNSFCTLGREKIPCSFSGEEMIIGFSAMFIIDIFNTISTDTVVANFIDPSRPGVFTPFEQKEGTDLLMLLMPMTVSEF